MRRKVGFEIYYKEFKKYYEEHGDLLVPFNYCVETEVNGEKILLKLGVKVHHLRGYYNGTDTMHTLTDEKIKLLEDIGMVWNAYKDDDAITDRWFKNYKQAKIYFEEHGNLLVPIDYSVEIEESGKKSTINLGKWISTQRYNFMKNDLSNKKINLLNDINMVWDIFYYNFINNVIKDYYIKTKMLKLEKIVLEVINSMDETKLTREEINKEVIYKLSNY